MVWVWLQPKEGAKWGADFDIRSSAPMNGVEYLSDKYLDPEVYRPLFRSSTSLKRFKALHCPPIGHWHAVDAVWKSIILKFVPGDRIQFLPIRLIARDKMCDDFFWLIILDRAFCTDPERSIISRKLQKGDKLIIFKVEKFVHLPNCLGEMHIARDYRMKDHVVISDSLKEALSSTGEDSMFYRVEDLGQRI